jgi:hypothetical protein
MKTDSQTQRLDGLAQRDEQDPNELLELTLDESSEVGGSYATNTSM